MTSMRRSPTRSRAGLSTALASMIAISAIAMAASVVAVPLAAQEVPASGEPALRAAGPDILRGSVAPPPPAVEPAAGPAAPLVTAGDRIWFVDQERRRLTGCRLIDTIQVDTQAIRCTERRLPRGVVARD